MNVRDAVAARRSVRAFKPDAVPLELVAQILAEAARAPSGSNLQPWRVHVLAGKGRERLIEAVRQAKVHLPRGEAQDHQIHPSVMSPLEEKRYKRAGELMYAAAGVERSDQASRAAHQARGWEFFGAPVGLIFTLARRMQPGQWADVGMYMQTVMLLALDYGLTTCAQETWALWGNLIRRTLGLAEDQIVYSGMAIGYPDLDAPVNRFRSERAPIEEFVSFYVE